MKALTTPARHVQPKVSSKSFLHDLRTPLNQIIGYSELLQEQASAEGQAELASDLHKIEVAGQQMLTLVNANAGTMRGTGQETIDLISAPPAATDEPSDVDEEPSDSNASHARILVVDDDSMNRDMLCRRLEQEGYTVSTANDGLKALEWIRTRLPDLVLLDIMMPQMDGYEVLSQMKADPALRDIPVVIVSALDETDGIARCIEMGAEDYLSKPINKTLLKARVRASLDRKRAHDKETLFYDQLKQNFEHLKRLERLRDDLTRMIIHDLRTPLSSVISGMQTLEMLGELSPDQREVMAIALSGGETLLSMINGLLDIDQMESGAMALRYTELRADELVASAVTQIEGLAEAKSLTLFREVAEDLPLFSGDEEILRRTLVNLLGNAIKFTPAQGEITVAVHLENESKSVLFSVKDSGEGIPPESFEQIFEKFGQVESRLAGRTMSTGLGLTFCKLAVEAHGGKIRVESTTGEGSTFTFSIPLVQAEE